MAFLIPCGASGQESPTYQGQTLQEVVVTATKRAERLIDVPISVSALSGVELENLGAKDIEDVARQVPGLHLLPSTIGGGLNFSIRGISSAVGAGTVGIYIDDTPIQIRSNTFSQNPNPVLFDLDRVEVLRGPQGTLYGSGSEGGTIRFITTQPSFDVWSGKATSAVTVTKGGSPGFEAGVADGGPLSDVLAIRLSAYFRRDGGYLDRISRTNGGGLDNDINQDDTTALRLALSWKPTDRLTVTPSLTYQRLRSDDEDLYYQNLGPGRTAETQPTPSTDSYWLPSLTMKYQLDGVAITNVASYFKRTENRLDDYSTLLLDQLVGHPILPPVPNFQAGSQTASVQQNLTEELRASSTDPQAALQWTAGFYFEHARQTLHQVVVDPELALIAPIQQFPGGIGFLKDQAESDQQIAGFGEVTYRLTQTVALTAGLRVTQSDYGFQYVADGFVNGGRSVLPETSTSDTSVDPRFVVTYQPTDRNMFYVSAARGNRPGGANRPIPVAKCAADLAAAGATPATYDPDDVWSYEIGAKNRFLADRLSVDASLFYIDWNDIQQGLDLPTCTYSYTANLGKATSQGFDLDARAIVTPGLSVDAKAGYTRSTLSQNVFGTPNPVTGLSALIGQAGGFLQFVPEWTIDLGAEYDFDAFAGFQSYSRADYEYASSYRRTPSPGTALYDPLIYRGSSYNQVSLRTGLRGDRVDVALYVDNLLDTHQVLYQVVAAPVSRSLVFDDTFRPRTIGLSLSYRF